MKFHFRTANIAPCLAGLLTAVAAGSCAGPAGVRPQQGQQTILRSCTIDQNMLAGKTDITVEAGRCPVLTLSGNPLTLQADQRLVIPQAERIRIDGALTVAGAIELSQVRIDGPGQITFGSSELAPASVKITDSVIGADESGNAPALTLFGGGRSDCSGADANSYRVVPLLVGTHINGSLRRALSDLNGTYESPCMSSEQNENNSFRRVFTYDNVIEPHASLPFVFAPLRLRFVRTIINYEGAGCDTPAYTSHMAGTATYYILRGEPDEQGNAPETLASRVWYDFNQLVWTYHNPNVIQTLNEQNFCEVNTWQVNVPQDVTHKKCFGDGFRFNGYHDRYELRSDRNLHLALDFDDRPDDLKDQIPAVINKETVYARK